MNNSAYIFHKINHKNNELIFIDTISNSIIKRVENGINIFLDGAKIEDDKILISGLNIKVDDGPIIVSSRVIKFYMENELILELRNPKLRELFKMSMHSFSKLIGGYRFIGMCSLEIMHIEKIILFALSEYYYFGSPSAW